MFKKDKIINYLGYASPSVKKFNFLKQNAFSHNDKKIFFIPSCWMGFVGLGIGIFTRKIL